VARLAKIAITEALLDAGGDRDGDAARAAEELRQAIGTLFRNAQQAGAVRNDVELPEVYALLIGKLAFWNVYRHLTAQRLGPAGRRPPPGAEMPVICSRLPVL
jgi:hypothetical protein